MSRALIQILEGWRRSGISWVPHVEPVSQPTSQPSAESVPVTRPTEINRTSEPVDTGDTSMPKKTAQSLGQFAPRCDAFQPLDLPRSERVTQLETLKARVAKCQKCSELATTRTQTVFGVGNPEAKIVFVGEAPGADEDRLGEPFVGRAGQLLNDIIRACRLTREEIYICNILRCRPPGNRLPSFDEAQNCREFLDGQLAVVNPDYIVCWGSCAAKNLLGSDETIGKLRGRFYSYGRAKVLCTYHPSYLLRNPSAKKDVWDDMKFLFRDQGIDLSAK